MDRNWWGNGEIGKLMGWMEAICGYSLCDFSGYHWLTIQLHNRMHIQERWTWWMIVTPAEDVRNWWFWIGYSWGRPMEDGDFMGKGWKMWIHLLWDGHGGNPGVPETGMVCVIHNMSWPRLVPVVYGISSVIIGLHLGQ